MFLCQFRLAAKHQPNQSAGKQKLPAGGCNTAVFLLLVMSTIVTCQLVTANAYCQEASALVWKFAKGETFAITMQQTSSVETTVDRRTVNHSTEMTLKMNWLVESVDTNQVARIKQTITGVNLSMIMPSSEGPKVIEYDSSSEARPTGDAARIAESFGRLINQPVFVSVTPRGEITAVDIPSETMESIREMPGSMEGRQSLSLESIRNMFRQANVVLPEEPIAPNDSWTAEKTFELPPQAFNQKTTYNFSGNHTDESDVTVAVVNFSSVLDVQQDKNEANSAQLKITEQSLTGELRFDANAGFCHASNSETLIKTQATYRDMQIRTTVNSQLNVSFEKGD